MYFAITTKSCTIPCPHSHTPWMATTSAQVSCDGAAWDYLKAIENTVNTDVEEQKDVSADLIAGACDVPCWSGRASLAHACSNVGWLFIPEAELEGTGSSSRDLSGTSDMCGHKHPVLGCHKSTCGKKMRFSNMSVDFSEQVAQMLTFHS